MSTTIASDSSNMRPRRTQFRPVELIKPTQRRRAARDALDAVWQTGLIYSRKKTVGTPLMRKCPDLLVRWWSVLGKWWRWSVVLRAKWPFKLKESILIDLCIRLWDFHQEDITTPIPDSLQGPKSNILSLAFSATNKYLYSGGADHTLLKFDVSQLGSLVSSIPVCTPEARFEHHDDSVRAVSCHPFQEEIFLSAGEDGRILLHDGRSTRRRGAQGTLQLTSEATGAQYHPLMDHLFATSDSQGRVRLRDTRMAFGPLSQRSNDGIVLSYHTTLTKQISKCLCNPEASSLTFDRDGEYAYPERPPRLIYLGINSGTKLAVTMLHYLPTIYSVSDPNPLAVCSGQTLPDGTPVSPGRRTYANSCTMKHGSFGGPMSDSFDYYAAGSDDFQGYVWKIPSTKKLTDSRQEIDAQKWTNEDYSGIVAFSEGLMKTRFVPMEISTPFSLLAGHDSIVNTAVFHPHMLHIVTSGIERDIILHSPTSSSPCTRDLPASRDHVRVLPVVSPEDDIRILRTLASSPLTLRDETETGRDDDTIEMFDFILRHEGEGDVFALRPWREDEEMDGST